MFKNMKNLFLKTVPCMIVCLLSASMCVSSAPEPWQIGFQPAATPVMEQVNALHNIILWIIIAIVIFVTVLLLYTCWRFHEKRNPVPSKTSHHVGLEVAWTIIPILILCIIGVPSIRLIYFMDKVSNPEITLKVIGHQWYWEYTYPENDLNFDSYMIKDTDLEPGQKRLLEVDQPVILPVNTNIRILTTSDDVIHSFGVPAFGIKQDSVPGRLAEIWINVKKTGTYYGQCYELCGMSHGFMPIQIQIVSKAEYGEWMKQKGGKMTTQPHINPTSNQTEITKKERYV